MKRSWLLAIPFVLLASPALALQCSSDGFALGGGVFISGRLHIGEPYSAAEIARFDEMELRRRGVDVARAERWAGCVRAWVRQPDGSQRQQFFDPNTYQRLDPATSAPLDLRLR